LGLDIEAVDPLKASTVTFKFICFKTPWGRIDAVPKRFFFSFKFFTFPAVKTATVQMKPSNDYNMHSGGGAGNEIALTPGYPYYLSRVVPSQQNIVVR